MCFSHLFGFALSFIIFRVTTPIFTASSIRNSSIFWALMSLSSSCALSTVSNFTWNSSVVVCALHFCALILYSLMSSPYCHLYTVVCFLSGLRAGYFSWLGSGAHGTVVWVFGASRGCFSGRVVYIRSWSVILSSYCGFCCTCRFKLLHSM
jgi:hypothetical protein